MADDTSEETSTEPLLKLMPPRLNFPPPYTKIVQSILTIQNTSDKIVAYKVKTTAPKRYCVRPTTGTIRPHGTTEVQILLNALKAPPKPKDAAEADKFMILSMIVDTEYEGEIPKDLWLNKQKIIKQKLRCYFKGPSDGTPNKKEAGDDADFVASTPTSPSMYQSAISVSENKNPEFIDADAEFAGSDSTPTSPETVSALRQRKVAADPAPGTSPVSTPSTVTKKVDTAATSTPTAATTTTTSVPAATTTAPFIATSTTSYTSTPLPAFATKQAPSASSGSNPLSGIFPDKYWYLPFLIVFLLGIWIGMSVATR